MAETGRKRLVPREYIEQKSERNGSFQELQKTLLYRGGKKQRHHQALLPKIKYKINEEPVIEPSPPANLTMQVEMEVCEKYIHCDQVIISTDAIRSETEKMMELTTSPVDKVIEIEIRNRWGKYVQSTKDVEALSYHDELLQQAFYKWKFWCRKSQLRSSFLAYQCYICRIGWWHLGPFRDHISQHENIYVEFACPSLYECCIVAYEQNLLGKMHQVMIEGKCWQCLKSYNEHIWSNGYNCVGCKLRFPTCRMLFEHEGVCQRYQMFVFQNEVPTKSLWTCEICGIVCLTNERYEEHLVLNHVVRSDMPIVIPPYKTCNLCQGKYLFIAYHTCSKTLDNLKCTFCYRRFQTKSLVVSHMKYTKRDYKCKVCTKYLDTQCMEVEHMVEHSKDYVLVYKCKECLDNILFADEKAIKKHNWTWHWRPNRRKKFYEAMIVPITCMSSKWAEGVTVEDMVLDNAATMTVDTNLISKQTSSPVSAKRKRQLLAVRSKSQSQNERFKLKLDFKHPTLMKNVYIPVKKKTRKEKVVLPSSNINVLQDHVSQPSVKSKDDNDDERSESSHQELQPKHSTLMKKVNIPVKVYSGKQNNVVASANINALQDHFAQPSGKSENDNVDERKDSSKQELQPKYPTLMKKVDIPVKRYSGKQNNVFALANVDAIQDHIAQPNIKCADNNDECRDDEQNETSKKELELKHPSSIKNDVMQVKVYSGKQSNVTCANLDGLQEPSAHSSSKCEDDRQRRNVRWLKKNDIKTLDNDIRDNDEVHDGNVQGKCVIRDSNDSQDTISIKPEIINEDSALQDEANSNQEENNTKDNDVINVVNMQGDWVIVDMNDSELVRNSINQAISNRELCENNLDKTDSIKEDIYKEINGDINEEDMEIKAEHEECMAELSKVFQASKRAASMNGFILEDEPKEELTEDNALNRNANVNSETEISRNDPETQEIVKTNRRLQREPVIVPGATLLATTWSPIIYKCKKCPFMGKDKEFKEHLKRKKANEDHMLSKECHCTKCDEKFPDLTKYAAHFYKHNLLVGTCPECLQYFTTITKVTTHLINHIRTSFVQIEVSKGSLHLTSECSGLYQCKTCAERVILKDVFSHWEKHLKLSEDNKLTNNADVSYEVLLPPKIIKWLLDQLEEHWNGTSKKCKLCHKIFVHHIAFKSHLIEHLYEDACAHGVRYKNALLCQLCKKNFLKAEDYRMHMRCHGGLPTFKCDTCHMHFTSSKKFAIHKRIMIVTCDVYQKKFHSQADLEKHKETHKSITKPVICTH